jgi:hypothetical protein
MTAPAAEQPTQQLPPFDPTNPHLTETPATLTASVIQTTVGPRLALTIRHTAGSATVFLARDNAIEWGQVIQRAASQMSGLIVPGHGVPLPTPQG